MKIAIDSRPLTGGHSTRGIGFYTQGIIDALQLQTGTNNIQIDVVDFAKTNLAKYDLVHYNDFHPFFITLPFKKPTKIVVTIHDLIQLLYPKNYPSGLKGKLRYEIQKRLLKKVDGVLTVSNTSKKDIIRFLGLTPEKIHVTYLAPRKTINNIKSKKEYIRQVQRKYNLPNKFVLYVGDINYNKNIPTLIAACRKCNLQLVICGKSAKEIGVSSNNIRTVKGPRDYLRFLFNHPHPEMAHYKMLNKLFEENDVIRVGFVSDRELSAIYCSASVYAQPSFYEGFGLCVLEAMRCGVPVVVSKTNALTEVAGDAALVADPHNSADMAKKIKLAVEDSDIRADLIRKGEKRSNEFSWEKTAKETLEIYKNITLEK